jgi:hypothetical protein
MHAVNVVGEALDHRVVEVIERGGEAVLWACGGRRRNRSRSVSALVDSSGLISASVPDQHTYLVATSDSRTCRPSARQSGNRYTALQQLQPKPGSGGLPRRAPCAAEPGIRVMASPKLLGGGMSPTALTWAFASSVATSSGYMLTSANVIMVSGHGHGFSVQKNHGLISVLAGHGRSIYAELQ